MRGKPVYVRNFAPAAIMAVKVVDALSAAVKLDEARELLNPDVLVLESGGAESGRDEYMRGWLARRFARKSRC